MIYPWGQPRANPRNELQRVKKGSPMSLKKKITDFFSRPTVRRTGKVVGGVITVISPVISGIFAFQAGNKATQADNMKEANSFLQTATLKIQRLSGNCAINQANIPPQPCDEVLKTMLVDDPRLQSIAINEVYLGDATAFLGSSLESANKTQNLDIPHYYKKWVETQLLAMNIDSNSGKAYSAFRLLLNLQKPDSPPVIFPSANFKKVVCNTPIPNNDAAAPDLSQSDWTGATIDMSCVAMNAKFNGAKFNQLIVKVPSLQFGNSDLTAATFQGIASVPSLPGRRVVVQGEQADGLGLLENSLEFEIRGSDKKELRARYARISGNKAMIKISQADFSGSDFTGADVTRISFDKVKVDWAWFDAAARPTVVKALGEKILQLSDGAVVVFAAPPNQVPTLVTKLDGSINDTQEQLNSATCKAFQAKAGVRGNAELEQALNLRWKYSKTDSVVQTTHPLASACATRFKVAPL